MIAVGVAEDQAVDLGGIDVEQVGVAQHDLRRVAEIQHVLRLGAGAAGFEVQRQAPLAGQRRHLAARHLADVLDGDERMRRLRQEPLVARVDDDPDGEPVDNRRGECFFLDKTFAHCSFSHCGIVG